ncbi:SDR family oxidoreductase [Nonomuraea sp. NPDC049784]|uniref:SDR family NAD(P)-dependent oxidoreductase n=1 Tax=Nonomuraea sp. NPDC049784 TaxID=3154361 RepID=UPI0034062693
MLLQDKNAIIYGGGGSLGGVIARTFAREGARVFVAGRTREPLDGVVKEVTAAGGYAEAAVLDALDERAVDEHARDVADRYGSLDVSFNLVSRGDVQGTPLIEMTTDDFTRPIVTGITANFITARAAARHMTRQGSGVILALDSGSAHTSPLMGGTCPADAALDTFIRALAAEVGPSGVRALGLWVAGVPETLTAEKLGAVNPDMANEAALQGVLQGLASLRMTRRSPGVAEVAETAAFLASDRAGGLTATFVNVTGGMFAS